MPLLSCVAGQLLAGHGMGICVHCGQSAGLFRSAHAECKARADEQARQAEEESRRVMAAAREAEEERQRLAEEERQRALNLKVNAERAITQALIRFVTTAQHVDQLTQTIDVEKTLGKLSAEDVTRSLVDGWIQAVDRALEDGILSEAENQRLNVALNKFALPEAELHRHGTYFRVVKASVLRQVLEGKPPSNVTLDDSYPVNLQRGEKPVWSFTNVRYLEDVVRRQTVGGSQGVSLRIMSGVYYRVGMFKGESVSSTERRHLDTGTLLLTTRHLYFVGASKTMRIPYAKVVAFTPYSDAVGLMRDAASAKPQFFQLDDAWFAHNLVVNLARTEQKET